MPSISRQTPFSPGEVLRLLLGLLQGGPQEVTDVPVLLQDSRDLEDRWTAGCPMFRLFVPREREGM